MKIRKVKLDTRPQTDGIKNALPKVDFADTFATTNHQESLEVISNTVFGKIPKWISFLMKIRNGIVKIFGLKTEVSADINRKFEVGAYISFFQILSIQQNELILGEDDKHLNFRVSVYNSKEKEFNIKITTLVQYNNWFGKVYMTIVKPFHHIVVKTMVKQAYKAN